MQIIQHQLTEVDDALAVKLLRQAEITDEPHLEQEIQNIQDRVSRTRQKMAAAAANQNEAMTVALQLACAYYVKTCPAYYIGRRT